MSLPKREPLVAVGREAVDAQPPKEERLLFRGYPHFAYVRDPYALNRTGIVYPGCDTVFAPRNSLDATKTPDELNRRDGITPGQAAACLYGLVYGWDHALANPMAYNAAGEYLGR